MKKKVLVTGAGGFAGRYLCEYLRGLKDGPEVIGTDVISGGPHACDVFYKTDLSSGIDTADLIKQVQPDYIIHLAGTFGTDDSQAMYRANVLSAAAVLEGVRAHKSDAAVIMAGSAAEYGKVSAEQLPVKENTPCQPVTGYGLSKLLATQIALYYHRVHSINVMIVRPFQLIGKGVTARLAPGAFAEQLKRAVSDKSKVIKVGNLESSRDFLDIHDTVEAIWMLCRKPAAGEIFNICSGRPVKIADLLKMMVTCTGADIKIEVDPQRLRGTSDVNTIFGSCEKLQCYCGWKPQTPLEISIRRMFK
jgi:GDP-4-dehydro-6-deoxy-D-mannose reductase